MAIAVEEDSMSLANRIAFLVLVGGSAFLPATTRQTAAQSGDPAATYAFSEGTGTAIADGSGNSNSGALIDAVAWGAGYFGNGITLDGAHSGAIEIPMSESLAAMATAFTIEMWVQPADTSDSHALIARKDYALLLFLNQGGHPVCIATLGESQYQVAAPAGIPAGAWSHVAVTYDGSVLRLYVNGLEAASTPAAGALPDTSLPFSVGRPWWGTFAGNLDEIRLYARGLAASEVRLDRQTPLDASTPFRVGAHTPDDQALGVLTTPLTAGFTRPVDDSTVTSSTFELRDSDNSIVPASVTYSATTRTATLTPAGALQPLSVYTVRVAGGNNGVRDIGGNALDADAAWSFTTATASTAPLATFAFSEGTGTTALDGSGNGNSGALVDAVSWGAGYFGNGVTLDGSHSGAVEVPMSESLAAMTSAFTIEMWVKPTDVSDSNALIARKDYKLLLFLNPGGHPVCIVTLGETQYQVAAPAGIATGTWSHIAVTYDGSALTLYVNGIQVDRRTASGALPQTLLPFTIGRPWWGTFGGSLDEIRLYRTALGSTAIAADMTAPVDPATPLQVSTTTPSDGSTGILTTPIAAGFTAAIDTATLTASTFALRDAANAVVPSTISYNPTTHVATLTPTSALSPSTTYSVHIAGGTHGVKSAESATLAADVTWSFTTATATTAPVAAFAFSEGTGITAADGSGNRNDGTLVDAVSWATGYSGNGVALDGVHSGAVEVPMSESLAAMATAFTIEMWVNPANVSDSNALIARKDYQFLLFLNPGGHPVCIVTLGETQYQVAAPAGIATGTWSHVAVTYDGSTLTLYVNGSQVAGTSASGALAPTLLPFTIGRPWWGVLAGSLDEVRLYRSALSHTQIVTDMTTPLDVPAVLSVVSRSPLDAALGVVTTPITATFSADVSSASLTSATFQLRDSSNGLVDSTVTYSAATRMATLTPTSPLAPLTDYTARVVGGSNGVQGSTGVTLAGDVTWIFRAAADAAAPSAAYAFYEVEGTTTQDYSGNGNTGTLVNNPTLGGEYIYFAGNDDGVSAAASDTLAFTTGFTFEGLVEIPTTGRMWNQMDAAGHPVYELGIRSDGNLYLTIHTTSGIYTVATLQPFPFFAALSATYDGSMLRLFLNATEVAATPASGSLVVSAMPMQLGRGASFYLLNVRIYRRAVTVDEMIYDFANPVGYVPPPPPPAPLDVSAFTPGNGAAGVLSPLITATFSRDIDPATLDAGTFRLSARHGAAVAANVTYDAGTKTATLTPAGALDPLRRYDASVVGGDTGVKAADGAALAGDVSWTFTTAAAASAPSLAFAFEDYSGTTTEDATGNGNTGSLAGGAAFAAGWFGDGVAFDGVDSRLDVPASETLALTNAFTFETWAYPAAMAGQLWSRRDASDNALYSLHIQPSGALQFTALTTTGIAGLVSATTVPLNAWIHIAVTYDGATLRLFLNGVEAAAGPASGSLVSSDEPIRFGEGYAGTLDEIRIYRRTLSVAEIATDMTTPVQPARPFIASLNPNTGVLGQAIVVSGGGFNAVQGASTVTFNDAPASVTSWNSRAITAIVPSLVTQNTQFVRVVVNGRQSNPMAFQVLPPPQLSSISPAVGPVGQVVTLDGQNFGFLQGSSNTVVTFNGVPATLDWLASGLQIRVPPGATTGPVVVTVDGRASNAVTFSVAPHVTSISASSGVAGQSLTLTGTTFGVVQGPSTVTFNGSAATVTSWSDTSVTAIAPANAGGAEQVAVTVGGLSSNALAFWVEPVPNITSLGPTFGGVGQLVGIAGSSFGATQGSNTVAFGGLIATVTSWSNDAIVVSVPIGAVTGPVVVTVNGQTSNGAMFTVAAPDNPLTITAQIASAATAAGWYGALPDITFTCTDNVFAVTSCPTHTSATADGINLVVARTATDAGGNHASITLLLNVDRTPPQLSIFSPMRSAIFPAGTTSITVRGSAADALSGLQSVTCAGVSATIVGASYTCDIPVADGTSTVNVQAMDNAGLVTARSLAVRVGDVAATSLTISPEKMTLMVGWGQKVSVTDDLGRVVSAGTWDISNPAIAELVIDSDAPEIHAAAAGTATLTFAKAGLSATAQVTILPEAATLPPGTTLWELHASAPSDFFGEPVPFQRGEVLRATPVDSPGNTPADLFFVEHSMYDTVFDVGANQGGNSLADNWPTRVRATTVGGQELWHYSPRTPARQVAVDDSGGLILNLGRLEGYGYYASREHAIERLDSNGRVTWDYLPADPTTTISQAAIHPDGTVYFVENTPSRNPQAGVDGAHAQLVALDGASGATTGRWPLYNSASGPIVREDGSVALATFRQGSTSADRSLWLAQLAPETPGPTLTQVNIDGLSEDYYLSGVVQHDNLKARLARGTDRNHLVPDGHGGLLLPVGVGDSEGPAYRRTIIYRIDDTNTVTGTLQINQGSVQIVVGDDAVWVLAQEPYQSYLGTPVFVVAFDPVTLSVISGEELLYDTPNELGTHVEYGITTHNYYEGPNLTLRYAKAGGGIALSGPRVGNTSTLASGLLVGWAPGSTRPSLQVDASELPATKADTVWPTPSGLIGNVATNPGTGVYVAEHRLPFDFEHTFTRIVPTHQELWLTDTRWGTLFSANPPINGKSYLTIGASSDLPLDGACVAGHLAAAINRDTDVNKPIGHYEKLVVVAEDILIRRILEAHANYPNDLDYFCWPGATDTLYNSNSYTSGLMKAVHAPLPGFPMEDVRHYPGWTKPVPLSEFQSR